MMEVHTMEEQSEQAQAILTHLKAWAYWYSRYKKISRGELLFASELHEEAAALEAYDEWDKACCWLEAHGIEDSDVVYDEGTETATLRVDWTPPGQ